jgi:hypothetical protein
MWDGGIGRCSFLLSSCFFGGFGDAFDETDEAVPVGFGCDGGDEFLVVT